MLPLIIDIYNPEGGDPERRKECAVMEFTHKRWTSAIKSEKKTL